MELFDIIETLKSFRIITDTRERETSRSLQRYKSFGVPWERGKLDYGDYCYNATLPNGHPLYDIHKPIYPCFAIERKESLTELAGNFTKGRERFKREFERAADNDARIFLLVENASWENLFAGKYRSKFHPAAFSASIVAWSIRYNLNIVFCKEETSGRLIKEILFRDLKERLENGFYDKEKETAV